MTFSKKDFKIQNKAKGNLKHPSNMCVPNHLTNYPKLQAEADIFNMGIDELTCPNTPIKKHHGRSARKAPVIGHRHLSLINPRPLCPDNSTREGSSEQMPLGEPY